MITYQQSSPSQDSSSEQEPLPELNPAQLLKYKKSLRQQKRLKNAIAYRFHQQKQSQYFSLVFNSWKDYTLLSYRGKIYEAIKHYQCKLMEKGIDGIVQYATATGEFRRRLVKFYYKFLIKKGFQGWVQVYRQGGLKQKEESSDTRSELQKINRNLDSLLNRSQQSSPFPTKPKQPLKNQKKPKNTKYIQKGLQQLKHAQQHIKTNKLMLGFIAIQSYINISMKNRNQSNRQQNQQYNESRYQPVHQQIQYQNQYQYQNQREDREEVEQYDRVDQTNGFERNTVYRAYGNNQSREHNSTNSMINSRRSAATLYQDLSGVKPSRSRRKLAPIVQQVQLPKFIKKQQSKEDPIRQKSPIFKNQPKKPMPRPTPTNPIPQYTEPIPTPKRSQQPQYKPQIPTPNPYTQKNQYQPQYQQLNQQKQKQLLQQKNQQQQNRLVQRMRKQKQEKKNRILGILVKAKIYQLCIINEVVEQYPDMFKLYKEKSVEFLQKIRHI